MHIIGKDKLVFNRLREGAASTNMVADCCKTLLCVDHPSYEEHVVLTFPEFCQIVGVAELAPPTMRMQIQDWPRRDYAKLPNLLDEPSVTRSKALNAFRNVPGGHGETFQEIMADSGSVEILGLPEGR